jgi:hypothetical protein
MRSAKYLCNNNNNDKWRVRERAANNPISLCHGQSAIGFIPTLRPPGTSLSMIRYNSSGLRLVSRTCTTNQRNNTQDISECNSLRFGSQSRTQIQFESGGVAVVLHSPSAIPRLQSRRNRFHDWPWACLWFRPSNALCYGSTNARFFLYESIAVVGLF